MTTYRLGSSSMVHTPGIIAWAINGYAFKDDQPQLLKTLCNTWSGIPEEAFKQLLAKEVPYTIEDETVVFSAEVDQ